jgi:hypothetical protein
MGRSWLSNAEKIAKAGMCELEPRRGCQIRATRGAYEAVPTHLHTVLLPSFLQKDVLNVVASCKLSSRKLPKGSFQHKKHKKSAVHFRAICKVGSQPFPAELQAQEGSPRGKLVAGLWMSLGQESPVSVKPSLHGNLQHSW